MFNFANLNDYEFELLCKDVMESILQIDLHTFPKGPDGGIDICDSQKNPQIIIQAKHYINSKYRDLFLALKKEIPKVQALSPKKYFVCSGLRLNKKQKNEIYELFKSYMEDCSHIIDSIELDDFLSEEENVEIVKKHYKLWLCSTSILSLLNNKNIFIDCEELICDIEKDISMFVQTSSYFEARKKLYQSGIIIITGAPGVGKSTISKMLLMHFAKEDFAVRYSTENSISDIKKVLSSDSKKKEIVLLDDFLGQHYLKIKDTKPNELKTLISFIKKNPNKKLILNSRITIIKEAIQTYIQFKSLMEENESNEYLIDLDKMSDLEKAQILYNHFYFNSLPREYFMQIKINENYLSLIKHKNYNPRIVEYVTKSTNYMKIPHNKYFKYVLGKFNNPEDVWRDEFRNRMEEPDRVLMNTLYSITDIGISVHVLEKAFNQRMRTSGQRETTLYTFKNIINRLGDSLLKFTEERGETKVQVINPSVNDYLRAELKPNINEQILIIEGATYIEQLYKVIKCEETRDLIIKKVISGELLKMHSLQNSPFYYYLEIVIDNNIYEEKIIENVKLSFERTYEHLSDEEGYSDIIQAAMSKKFIKFYHLTDILLNPNKMHYILQPIVYDRLPDIIEKYIERFKYRNSSVDEYEAVLGIFKNLVVEKLKYVVEEKVEEDAYEIISDRIDDYIDEYGDIDQDTLRSSVQERISDDIDYYLNDELSRFEDKLCVELDLFVSEDIISNINFNDAIDVAMQERNSDYNEDDHRSDWRSESDMIRYIFER